MIHNLYATAVFNDVSIVTVSDASCTMRRSQDVEIVVSCTLSFGSLVQPTPFKPISILKKKKGLVCLALSTCDPMNTDVSNEITASSIIT